MSIAKDHMNRLIDEKPDAPEAEVKARFMQDATATPELLEAMIDDTCRMLAEEFGTTYGRARSTNFGRSAASG